MDPDSDELVDSLVEANDMLLERVDTNLDEAAGLKSNKTNQTVAGAPGQQGTPIVSSWNRAKKDTPGKKDTNFRFLMAKNIQRPQLKFKDKIDNSNTPFIPIIKRKPNALRPFEVDEISGSGHLHENAQVPSSIADFVHRERVKGISSSSVNSTAHPYQYELEVFQPPENQLMLRKEELYDELEKTPFTMIETAEQLEQLCQHLATVTEFAVDLEAHSYRSFQGFCCLMQISTQHQDFLIDTLELRSELQILNDYFTNPNILKVLHGADMDIGWLQRDFGIYVVNMFDTGQAARVLNYEKYSLAFLLKKFCDVTANKQYQLADWRIRPLPSEMVRYAREDTHYLLYICDRMHNDLIKRGNANNNLLQSVYSRSKDICLKCYEKPLFTSESYRKVLEKHKRTFNTAQMHAFRLLFAWRDNIAREEDESCGFVLPNHMMFQIAETMPREAQGVLACCNPVPTLVKQYVNEIHMLIVQAKETALTSNKTISSSGASSQFESGSTTRQTVLVSPKVSQPSLIDSVNKPDLPTVNGDSAIVSHSPSSFRRVFVSGPAVIRANPTISLFKILEDDLHTDGQKKAERIEASFQNPFQKVCCHSLSRFYVV
ncbi:exosome component 10-like [Stylophora pistillata]|uniref:exosome component 10-like n=1 Tax=Stylophora pistillata TaxID=50429 RepID=UPI000C03C047|nr:exosome component 10-like [Stylophora pistillata]